jgi:hypothetical protein
VDRFLIIILPPSIILVAIGLSKIRPSWLFIVILAIFVVLSLRGIAIWCSQDQKENWREATAYVNSRARSGDAILFYAYFAKTPFEYYLNRLETPDAHLNILELSSEPYPAGGGKRLPEPNEQLLAQLPDTYEQVWLVLSHHRFGHIGRDVQSSYIQERLAHDYALVQEQKFRGIRVLVYKK